MELHPARIFADQAFQNAEDTGREVRSLTMQPNALATLKRRLQSAGMIRSTGFSDKPSPKGAVSSHSARYRGIEIDTARHMNSYFLVEYADGSFQHIPLDRDHHVA